MRGRRGRWFKLIMLGISTCLWMVLSVVHAQEQGPLPVLFLTGTDTSSPPSIELHVYGIDGQGNPLDLSRDTLTVHHDDTPVELTEVDNAYVAGTFTLFLVDIPDGVSGQIPAIEAAINQYASAPTMSEQLDYVAIYRVEETGAVELLAPTNFYNTVRNFFATPLTPTSGATALIDSTMGLLEQINSLKPKPDLAAAIVIISDGTDAVSTQFQPENVPTRAAELGIPVHTILLNNENLSPPSQLIGQNYLAAVAAGSRGLAASLDDSGQVAAIWSRIAAFRNQARVRYVVPAPTGGDSRVRVSLTNQPGIQAETTISTAANAPSVVINLPVESRALTLPDPSEPVRLRFSTTVTWLDGVERELTAAQLSVNGAVQTIPVENVEQFEAEINNLQFGTNVIQVVVLDEQGLRAASPPIELTVTEGTRNIPDELATGGGFLTTLMRLLGILVVLAILGGLIFLAWRTGWLSQFPAFRPPSRGPRVRIEDPPSAEFRVVSDGRPGAIAYLDVLESTSRMPAQIPLAGAEVRIGRSPTQADIVFENDITVSRLHASLMLEGSHYRLFDANSTSGTWVNEKQVPEYGIQLMDGDEIHLGAVHLRFRQPTSIQR